MKRQISFSSLLGLKGLNHQGEHSQTIQDIKKSSCQGLQKKGLLKANCELFPLRKSLGILLLVFCQDILVCHKQVPGTFVVAALVSHTMHVRLR